MQRTNWWTTCHWFPQRSGSLILLSLYLWVILCPATNPSQAAVMCLKMNEMPTAMWPLDTNPVVNSGDAECINSISKLVLLRWRRSVKNDIFKGLVFLYHNQRLTSGVSEDEHFDESSDEDWIPLNDVLCCDLLIDTHAHSCTACTVHARGW